LTVSLFLDGDDQFYNEKYLEDTLFTLESQSVDPDERLKPSIVVKIKHLQTNTYISTSSNIERPTSVKNFGGVEENKLDENQPGFKGPSPFKLNSSSTVGTDIAKHYLEASEISKDEDAFIIEQTSQEYIKDCLSIHAAIPFLKEYVHELRTGKQERMKNKERMKKMEALLTNIIFFVTDTEDSDPFTCEGIPFRERQKLMRELKVIEILCDALYYPFVNRMFTLESLGHIQTLSRVCGLLYKLIKHIVQDNRENEEYASQWIELFFDHAVNIGETAESYSEATITAILTNNKKLLDQQISRENISHIINLCQNQRKHERFLNLLSCLCICQGEAVIGNQNDIVEILMEDDEVRDIFVIPIRENRGGYEILLSKSDTGFEDHWIDLKQIKTWSDDNDGGRMYNYYLAFLNLATSLCYDRSYKGINSFLPIFPVEITFGCAKMEELPYAMRSRFTDLLLTLHVDKQPLEPLRVPALTRIWDVFEDGDDDMPVKEEVPDSLNVLKDFVKDYLINSKGQQKSYERDKNGMTLSVLNLAKSLVIFGFYRTEDKLIEMIDPLITLLDGSHDITSKSNNALESYSPGNFSLILNLK